MDVTTIVSLGLGGAITVALIVSLFWNKSQADQVVALENEIVTYAKDGVQKTLDAERAKADLVSVTQDRDAARAEITRLTTLLAQGPDHDPTLAPNDLVTRVLRVSHAADPHVSSSGAGAGIGAVSIVPPGAPTGTRS